MMRKKTRVFFSKIKSFFQQHHWTKVLGLLNFVNSLQHEKKSKVVNLRVLVFFFLSTWVSASKSICDWIFTLRIRYHLFLVGLKTGLYVASFERVFIAMLAVSFRYRDWFYSEIWIAFNGELRKKAHDSLRL